MQKSSFSLDYNSDLDSVIALTSSTSEFLSSKQGTSSYGWRVKDFDLPVSSSSGAFKFSSSNKDFYAINDFEVKSIRCAKKIISLLKNDDYIEGIYTKTELYLEKLHQEDAQVFKESFQKAWLELFELSPDLICNFIKIAAAIEYEWLADRADALALAGCSHVDPFVNDAALRAVESWSQKKHLGYLDSIRPFEIEWLNSYKAEVADYLRSIG